MRSGDVARAIFVVVRNVGASKRLAGEALEWVQIGDVYTT